MRLKHTASNIGPIVAVVATMGVSTTTRLQRLAELDLTNVRRKLQEPYPEGKGWTPEQALEAEKWYKRYLAAIITYPDFTQHVPNGPIDAFWHQHILDTMAYGPDCEQVLGYFLHHYPYFGLNGDVAERDNAFDKTNELYRLMFDEDCLQMKHFGFNNEQHSENGVNCGGGGSGTGCQQGCGKKRMDQPALASAGANCGSAGSGTGCGQGCSGGSK